MACLVAEPVGYYVLAAARGVPESPAWVVFWVVAGTVVGAVAGAAAGAVRRRSPGSPLAAGVLGGILVGEGVYGITTLAGSTPTSYWAVEITVGALGGLALGLSRPATARSARWGRVLLGEVAATLAVAAAYLLGSHLPVP